MELGRSHWLAAFAGALALHALVAAVWLWQAPASGAASAGLGGVTVSLGPSGGAPGSEARQSEASDSAEPVAAAESVEAEQLESVTSVTPEAAEVPPVAPETAQVIETPVQQPVEPLPQPELTELAEVPAVEAKPVDAEPQPEIAKAVEPPEAATAREVVAAVPPPPKPRDLPEAPKRKPKQAAQPVAKAAPASAAQVTEQVAAATAGPPDEAASSVAGAGGMSGTQARRDSGNGPSTSGGGLPGESADYLSLLQAWLEKHKVYPERAQARRQEGTVLLYFVMDRDGKVLDHRIVRGSGHPLLDREAEEMIARADPLPAMPDSMQRDRLELVVPVQFLLR
ncbi:protein TonB [Tistlia consotensis]|uniref:Protein TonB n=1 Tax=Tistlia consotensis USBA 355 TaxID=560819 RepID=A0A1Y6BNM5_9PROT|nr:energy transducer TonB [Tistlia consotensis]SMF19318.1 protein TonB [Tistlia consotensis USBA 355]SNR39048.1 protein TonB [Tistlia consotensis]